MSVFKNLFVRSPFAPLQSHMEKATECAEKLEALYEAYLKNDSDSMNTIADEISELEHSADLTKNEIRNNLPSGLFLAVNRGDLLDLLDFQDKIADKSQDIGVLMTVKKLEPIEEAHEDFKEFLLMNIKAVKQAQQIVREMDELLQSSFGGKEAEKVEMLVEEVAYMEHEVDVVQKKLLKKIYNEANKLHYSSFILWMNIMQAITSLSNNAQNLANRVRMLLDLK